MTAPCDIVLSEFEKRSSDSYWAAAAARMAEARAEVVAAIGRVRDEQRAIWRGPKNSLGEIQVRAASIARWAARRPMQA